MKKFCQKNIRLASYITFSHFIVPKQYSSTLIVSGDRTFLDGVWDILTDMIRYVGNLADISLSKNLIMDKAKNNCISRCLAVKDNYEEVAGFCGKDLLVICDEPTTPPEHLQVISGYQNTEKLFYVYMR